MRIPFIAANWKMFKTVHESVVFVKELRLLVKDVEEVEIVIAPPFTAIHAAAEAARNTNIGVGGQDDAHRLYRRDTGGAGAQRDAGSARSPDQGRVRSTHRGTDGGAGRRV